MAVKRRPANTQPGATTSTHDAFSPRGNAIHSLRINATDGKVERVLGKYGPFTDEFKNLIRSDYESILETPYLIRELKGAKKILKALGKRIAEPKYHRLFHKIASHLPEAKEPCMLSPIWRHDNCVQVLTALSRRYIYPEVKSESFFLTIIYGYADNLDSLGILVDQFRRDLDTFVKTNTTRQRGLVLAGALEPDLRSYNEITGGNSALAKISAEHGWSIQHYGGWVLSGHFVGRGYFHDELKSSLAEVFPSRGKQRVRFDPLSSRKDIYQSIMDLIGYFCKFSGPMFASGKSKIPATRFLRKVQSAFVGPNLRTRKAFADDFDQDEAIRQWALFVDDMGPDKLLYSVENVHAQKWYSQTEVAFLKKVASITGDYSNIPGAEQIEIHRDREPYSKTINPRFKHKVPRRRTRPLQVDPDWYRLTDKSGDEPTMMYSLSL